MVYMLCIHHGVYYMLWLYMDTGLCVMYTSCKHMPHMLDREAREIMYLVASVRPSVCPSVRTDAMT